MNIIDLGVCGYQEVLSKQKELMEWRRQGEMGDTLLLVEHPHVFTAGRALQKEVSEREGGVFPSALPVSGRGSVPVVPVERGGKWTYHGPGQLVGYPIVHLEDHDLRRFLRELERGLMVGLEAVTGLRFRPCPENLELEPGQLETGVWFGNRKVASIGIAVKHWVSYHGFAVNVSPDLTYFSAIEPCGFPSQIMTSLSELAPEKKVSVGDLKQALSLLWESGDLGNAKGQVRGVPTDFLNEVN